MAFFALKADKLFADGLYRACGYAGTTIDASGFIHYSNVTLHFQSTYRAYSNASTSTDAAFFVDLNSHDKTPLCFGLSSQHGKKRQDFF